MENDPTQEITGLDPNLDPELEELIDSESGGVATGGTEEKSNPDETEELRKKLKTAEAQKDHWKKKATKDPSSTDNHEITSEKPEELSSKDLYAMIDKKVPQEDVEEVTRIAKALNLTIPDALKSNVVKTILSDNAEKRKSADVANTDNTRMGPTQLSDEALIANADKGELPESDEDIARLIAAKNVAQS